MLLVPGFSKQSRPPRVEQDVESLLTEMRRRFYPETIPVLASFWLKTVVAREYGTRQWRQLDRLLERAASEQPLSEPARQALLDIREWMGRAVLLKNQAPKAPARPSEEARVTIGLDELGSYVARLLNEWLPREVARLLVKEDVSGFAANDTVPVLAIGAALEALLIRERLSTETLEAILQPGQFSPHEVYPAELEMLRDVVLWLLGRTSGPPLPTMPATLLCVGPDSPLPANFRDAVADAFFVERPGAEEVQVPVAAAKVPEILRNQPVRLASVVVTMDGRWWEPEKLQGGSQNTVAYRPVGRLRLDYSADHLRLRAPWPEARAMWSGSVHFPDSYEIFGRAWRVVSWEKDTDRTWLHLEFVRVLPAAESVTDVDAGARRTHPASVDMAWAALGNALAGSIAQRSGEAIERLRHPDLIPLGRSLFGLAALLLNQESQSQGAVESQLAAIRYWETQVSPAYGRIPWRILPAAVRVALYRCRSSRRFVEQLSQVFDSLPDKFTARRQGTLRGLARFRNRRFPPRAA